MKDPAGSWIGSTSSDKAESSIVAVPPSPRTKLVSVSTLAVLPRPQATKWAQSEEVGEQNPSGSKKTQSVPTLLRSHVCLGHIKWWRQTKPKLRPSSSRHMSNWDCCYSNFPRKRQQNQIKTTHGRRKHPVLLPGDLGLRLPTSLPFTRPRGMNFLASPPLLLWDPHEDFVTSETMPQGKHAVPSVTGLSLFGFHTIAMTVFLILFHC